MAQDVWQEPFLDSVREGDLDRIVAMVGRHPDLLTETSRAGAFQPLHLAATHGRAEVAAYLMAQGGPADLRDDQGMTPLHHAARYGHREACERLLEAGADPRALDMRGWSILHWAMQEHDDGRRRAVVNLLLAHGAGLDIYCALVLGDLATARQLVADATDLSAPPLADMYLCVAIPAAGAYVRDEPAGATSPTKARCRDSADIIRAMVAKHAPLCRLNDALWMSLRLSDPVLAECLLEIGMHRSLWTGPAKAELAPAFFNASRRSRVGPAMAALLKDRGFAGDLGQVEGDRRAVLTFPLPRIGRG